MPNADSSRDSTLSVTEPKPPIKGGWRGYLAGAVEGTSTSYVEVSEVTLRLDRHTAYALCNLLYDSSLNENHAIEDGQRKTLSNLGAALGRLIDHTAANNGGRKILA